jgi:Domain of unknown function (DUF4279)
MTQIKLVIAIFGDQLDIESLSALLNLSPTSSWRKGDLVPNRKKIIVRTESCWEYSLEFIETLILEDVSDEFIKLMSPNIGMIEKYIKKNNLESKIFIVVEMFNDETPSLYIGKKFMEIVLSMNGEIDIDMYYLS